MAAVVEKQEGVIIGSTMVTQHSSFPTDCPLRPENTIRILWWQVLFILPKTFVDQEQQGVVIGDPLGSF
jgi:hypothetical protein